MMIGVSNEDDFQDGYIQGQRYAVADIALERDNTAEDFEKKLKTGYGGEKSEDWYAGTLAGYRVQRSLS